MTNPGQYCCKLPSKAPKEDKGEVTEILDAAKESSLDAALRGSFIRTGSQWTTCFDFYCLGKSLQMVYSFYLQSRNLELCMTSHLSRQSSICMSEN